MGCGLEKVHGLRSRPPNSSAISLEHRLSAEYCRFPGGIIFVSLPPEGATVAVFSSCCFHGRKTIGKYLSRTIPPRGIGVPGYFPTYAFAGPLLSLYVSTHISSTSFSLDFPIPGRKLCSLNMNINYRMRMRLVQVLSSDLSSAQDVYSENGKVVSRAAVEALVRELVDKYGFRLRLQKAVGPIKVLIVWKWVLHARMQECKNARMQEMPHSTSTWQAGGQPIT